MKKEEIEAYLYMKEHSEVFEHCPHYHEVKFDDSASYKSESLTGFVDGNADSDVAHHSDRAYVLYRMGTVHVLGKVVDDSYQTAIEAYGKTFGFITYELRESLNITGEMVGFSPDDIERFKAIIEKKNAQLVDSYDDHKLRLSFISSDTPHEMSIFIAKDYENVEEHTPCELLKHNSCFLVNDIDVKVHKDKLSQAIKLADEAIDEFKEQFATKLRALAAEQPTTTNYHTSVELPEMEACNYDDAQPTNQVNANDWTIHVGRDAEPQSRRIG